MEAAICRKLTGFLSELDIVEKSWLLFRGNHETFAMSSGRPVRNGRFRTWAF